MPVVGVGRASAAVLGSAVASALVAVAAAMVYPDLRGIERLYAGVFIGTVTWVVAIFAALLARSGVHAWARMAALAAVAAALVVSYGGRFA